MLIDLKMQQLSCMRREYKRERGIEEFCRRSKVRSPHKAGSSVAIRLTK